MPAGAATLPYPEGFLTDSWRILRRFPADLTPPAIPYAKMSTADYAGASPAYIPADGRKIGIGAYDASPWTSDRLAENAGNEEEINIMVRVTFASPLIRPASPLIRPQPKPGETADQYTCPVFWMLSLERVTGIEAEIPLIIRFTNTQPGILGCRVEDDKQWLV